MSHRRGKLKMTKLMLLTCACLLIPGVVSAQYSNASLQTRSPSAQGHGQESSAEELAGRVVVLWNEQDLEGVPAVFSEDAVYEDVAAERVMEGHEEIRRWWAENFAAVPDFKIEVVRVFATADMAGCEWTMSGTHTGDYPTIPATGKAFSVRGASIAQVEAGKVVRWTDYYDMLAFLTQLGVVGDNDH